MEFGKSDTDLSNSDWRFDVTRDKMPFVYMLSIVIVGWKSS